MSASAEMYQRMAAAGDEAALSALGPGPVQRQTEVFLQAVQAAIKTDPEAWR
ncbi:hypothetical protein ACFXGT_37390 [Streptomyces sp. NPDC059352]|uniref:hypothetical protein n=1 Tax=Streptomyces sp. NPDC059352 TaxID=3346810 RepID=UPI0036C28713